MSSFTEIPLIDVHGLESPDPALRKKVIEELRQAAEQVGFLYVSGHGIAPDLFQGVRHAAENFFALPMEDKLAVHIRNSRNHRGYVPEGEEIFYGGTPDCKEAFDLSFDLPATDPDYVSGNPLLGPNQWPAGMPDFQTSVMAYYEAVFALGQRLLRGFALALGLPGDSFTRLVTKPPSQLRLIHYPFDETAEDRPGIGAHTDYEIFTLLYPTAPGLEVINGKGDWIDAPPVDGTLVVNIGDVMEAWSNGRFKATSHRVRKVAQERYSFPLFFSADYHTRITPVPAMVTEEKPAAYQPFVAGEHLHIQTVNTFRYLQDRLKRGEISLPDDALAPSPFGRDDRAVSSVAL